MGLRSFGNSADRGWNAHPNFNCGALITSFLRPRPALEQPKQVAMDKLPQELIDKIISSIDRTRPAGYFALLACSRVCRSWRRQAQKEFFCSAYFMGMGRLRRWDRIIPLESEVPSYVRHLDWDVLSATRDRLDPFLEKTFPGRFASFSNVEILSISNLSLRSFDAAAVKRTFSHISHSLRSLVIHHLRTNPEKWCLLVSLLPNLRYIDVCTVTMLEGGGGPGPHRPASFDFTGHIAHYGPETEEFFRSIADLHPRFESLGVRMVGGGSVGTLNLVMQSCSATLTTVSISRPGLLVSEGSSSLSRLFAVANLIRSCRDNSGGGSILV